MSMKTKVEVQVQGYTVIGWKVPQKGDLYLYEGRDGWYVLASRGTNYYKQYVVEKNELPSFVQHRKRPPIREAPPRQSPPPPPPPPPPKQDIN